MKNLFYIILALSVSVIISCENDTNELNNNKVSLVKTIPGGCNNQGSAFVKSISLSNPDTVEFTINGDTLNMYIGVNYICCAPFTSSSEFTSDTLIITINDTCNIGQDLCYCRCNCYYTWDFKYLDFENKEYIYKVELSNPREPETIIFREGKIDVGSL